LHIKHSKDLGRTWVENSTFNPDKNDIRGPKFAVIENRLFPYALDNNSFNPEPYQTVYSYTENGKDWSPLENLAWQTLLGISHDLGGTSTLSSQVGCDCSAHPFTRG